MCWEPHLVGRQGAKHVLSDFSLTTCFKGGNCMEMSKALSGGFSMYNVACNLYANLDLV